MKTITKISTVLAGLALGATINLSAEEVTLPYTFSAGETAKASEVNANFETLKNAVNSKNMPKVESVYAGGSGDFRTATRVLGSVTITAPASGKVVVEYSGAAWPDDGDSMVISASHSEQWQANDGIVHANVSVMGVTGGRVYAFVHKRIYDVATGDHTYYATARNWVKTDGSGNASIYGVLTATFYPNQN